MPRNALLSLAVSFLSSQASLSLAAAQVRPDLQSALATRLCQSQSPLEARELWQLGVFDAQMQAAWIDADEPIALADLLEAAQQQAAKSLHQGYAFGLCDSRRAWIVTSPAPAAILRREADSIVAATSLLQGSCTHYDLDTAEAAKGMPRSLQKKSLPTTDNVVINANFLKAGTVAVTCHPPGPATRGPELWALMPVGRWDYTKVPDFDAGQYQGSAGLKRWIEQLRASHSLKPLHLNKPIMKRYARELLQATSIRHPRALLLTQAAELKKKKGKFLGENRVKASSSSEMAWLLWHSPQHRRLLLNKEANALGLELSRLDLDELAVLVLARL